MWQKKFWQKKNDILKGEIKIKYHVDCRKSYTSAQNIDYILQSDSVAGTSTSNYSGTRFKLQSFDIRNMCLICSKSGTKKKKVLVSVQTGNLIILHMYVGIIIRIRLQMCSQMYSILHPKT